MSYPCRMTDPFLPTYDFNDIPTDAELAAEEAEAKAVTAAPNWAIWPFPVSQAAPAKNEGYLGSKIQNLWIDETTQNISSFKTVKRGDYVVFMHPDQAMDLRQGNIDRVWIDEQIGTPTKAVPRCNCFYCKDQVDRNNQVSALMKQAARKKVVDGAVSDGRVSQFGNIKVTVPPDTTHYTSEEVDALYSKLWSDK